jgi:hypothetical protein
MGAVCKVAGCKAAGLQAAELRAAGVKVARVALQAAGLQCRLQSVVLREDRVYPGSSAELSDRSVRRATEGRP